MPDPSTRDKHATITDVARHAGVAVSTVSYALSGKRPVSEAVRERIQASIEALGYEPHAGARALASRRAQVLALMVPLRSDMHIPILMQFATSIVTEARTHDHDVLLLTHEAGPDDLLRVAKGSLVDAVILMDVEQHDPRIPTLPLLGRPAVLIGIPEDPADLVCTDLDWVAAGALGVEHLVELGHTRIGLLGQPAGVHERGTGFAERLLRGFTQAADDHRVAAATRTCEASFDSVRAGLDGLADEVGALTGLVVHNEPVVPLLLEELSRRGVRVPEDLSVVAVGPDDVAERAPIRLTSVAVPVDQIGRCAVDLVMAQLAGRAVDPLTLLPPRVVERGSTARRRPT